MTDMGEHRDLEEQLRQAQKMEAVGRLAGGIAHDFNNLLTVILGYAEIVRGTLGSGHPGQRGIDQIEKAGRRAEELARQLLAFSCRQMLQPKILDLGDIVSDTEHRLRRLTGEDIEVRTISRPHLGRVEADPGQIVHVILNLTVNARDAMPQGGSLVIETSNVTLDATEVEPHRGIKAGEYVMLTVTDTGLEWPPRRKRVSSSPSSPRGTREPASVSPWCTASSSRAAAIYRYRASRARAQRFGFYSRASRRIARPRELLAVR
jgi:two-component system cell cycle sensor histidine kinase/response regulator CckA